MTSTTTFAFRAVHRNGALETGVLEAPSREAAVSLLSSQGAFAIEVSPETSRAKPALRAGAQDLAAGLRALATLLASGMPISKALSVLDDLVPPAWLAVLPDVRQQVAQGRSLATAVEASSLPLPSHIIGILQAGEAGSGLARAVEGAAQLLEARAETQGAVRNALAYPMMLATGGSASVALLIGVVLPRFATLLADAGRALPLSTRLVLGLGAVLHAALLPGLCVAGAGALLWRAWVMRPEARARWHELLLSAPAVGALRRSSATAQACSALAALLDAGVALLGALPHAARATGDLALEARLLAARRRIERGERIAAALEREDAMTPAVVRLIRVGEESGQLAHMLRHAARIEANHHTERLRRMIRLVEPVMILFFGGVVMLVAAALFQAMYGLRPTF